jgi:signal transduction histidine kinase
MKKFNIYLAFLIVVVFGSLTLVSAEVLSDQILNEIRLSKQSFYDLENKEIDFLKSRLTQFMANDTYKQVFLQGDRERLCELSLPLFQENKEKYGFTHFYYESLNDTIFLRVHQPSNYGDPLRRTTYLEAKQSGSWGAGIDLGKTAFALRVVSPYYYQGTLIGYVEFGKEINHLISSMKGQSSKDYGIVVSKKYISSEEWSTLRKNKNLRDNYEDLKDYVLIDTTREDEFVFSESCLPSISIASISDEGNFIQECEIGDKTYALGGFALYDAADQKVGSVMVVQDITTYQGTSNLWIYIAAGLGVLLIGSIIYFLFYLSKRKEGYTNNALKGFSLRTKLFFGFSLLLVLMMVLTISTYVTINRIHTDEKYLNEVNAPLTLGAQQVMGYGALLTGSVHEALLHAEKGEHSDTQGHQQEYDVYGAELDQLLKIDAPLLVNKSRRSTADKDYAFSLLRKMDEVNLKLVVLETGAFIAMKNGDVKLARSYVVSSEYTDYKEQLSTLYTDWGKEEERITAVFNQRVSADSQYILIANVVFPILAVIAGIIIAFLMSSSIVGPLRKIYSATQELEKGNFNVRTEVKTGDEVEELSNSFNRATERLGKLDQEKKQLEEAKTRFMSITSHELRSPMTPMKAQLQMLEEGYFGKLKKKQKDATDIVLRNTERLDNIIMDFLEISRIEAARLKFTFIKTDLALYIKRLVEEMKGFMPEKNISLVLNLEKLPVFEVDPDRVMQVLRNLINNAIKFSKDNGKVLITISRKGKFILFSVQDFGIGIKPEAQPHIFEPFFQAEQTMYRQYGGTGLGLAICRGIIRSQEGEVWFKSNNGEGTTFNFTIPLKPVRDIKPIKVLFSSQEGLEKTLKSFVIDVLGPMGESEFNQLKLKGLTFENLGGYFRELERNKVLALNKEFKKRLNLLFFGKEQKLAVKENISEKKFARFIKKRRKWN